MGLVGAGLLTRSRVEPRSHTAPLRTREPYAAIGFQLQAANGRVWPAQRGAASLLVDRYHNRVCAGGELQQVGGD